MIINTLGHDQGAHDAPKPLRDAPIEHAVETDLPRLIELLNASRPDCSPQTVWDLPWMWPSYRVVRDANGLVVGAATLDELDRDRYEIRGVAVDRAARGLGIATRLVRDLLVHADTAGFQTVCMTRRPGFFKRFGFQCVAPVWLPEHRWIAAGAALDRPRVGMLRHARLGSAA